MISIIDYSLGNVLSVKKALDFLEIPSEVTKDKEAISKSDGVILPGVGAFPYAMEKLLENDMVGFLQEQAKKKPFLGICLGMQLLFEKSYEVEECNGLALIPGQVVKFAPSSLKIPHMGWNSLTFQKPCPLLNGVPEGNYVYFVHSYYAVPSDERFLCATAEYGIPVPAVVSNGNVYGMQFHPEKSGDIGLVMLKNFNSLCRDKAERGIL